MGTLNYVILFSSFGLMLGWVFYVVFGQVTVRKLRRNPITKAHLGVEFISGWDIFNVAQALATPRKFHKILEKGKLAFLNADSEILLKNTNTTDRVLAIIFFWTFFLSGSVMIFAILIDTAM
ncbi:hypothetical protein ACONUD_18520 [Microbulbifer harenosus]|uniref:Uncharacterized protein n=1 Tax=Microbulbifer harenosus TaxID=2576840 RepID=A0ABY2UCZ6_9GAMM|nr:MULTISPECIES: hypothetical protein [Microbulbifer]QIL90245.1 hypothetical protein GNX18_11130 [Microbulbifer sp. SH-1]TLM73987.1 hypothetical protein FDY93_18265 [Microbulbifer harenosus]